MKFRSIIKQLLFLFVVIIAFGLIDNKARAFERIVTDPGKDGAIESERNPQTEGYYLMQCGTATSVMEGVVYYHRGGGGDNFVSAIYCNNGFTVTPLVMDPDNYLGPNGDGEGRTGLSGYYYYKCPVNKVLVGIEFHDRGGSSVDNFVSAIYCSDNSGAESEIVITRPGNYKLSIWPEFNDKGQLKPQDEGYYKKRCSVGNMITAVEFHDKGSSGDNFIAAIRCDSIPPTIISAPTNVRFTVVPCGTERLDLAWNAVSGATGYKVYEDGQLIATINSASTLTYSHTGLKSGDMYSYQVSAFNSTRESPRAPLTPLANSPANCFNYIVNISPTTVDNTQGASSPVVFRNVLSDGRPNPVTMTVSGLPSGASISPTTLICSPDPLACNLNVTVTTLSTTPIGSYPITVRSNANNENGVAIPTKTNNFTLNVRAPVANTSTLNILFGGNGSGKVSSSIIDSTGEITSPTSFSKNGITNGTPITLTPSAITGSTFIGWLVNGSNTTCIGTGQCNISLNSDTTVIANFDIITPVNVPNVKLMIGPNVTLLPDGYYGTNNSSTKIKSGQKFSLKWNVKDMTGYTCTPNKNTKWTSWNDLESADVSVSGSMAGLSTDGLAKGTYTFDISCRNGPLRINSTATLNLTKASIEEI